jgi:hypothetical protein
MMAGLTWLLLQYGGSPVKVGEEEFHLFRDSE